MSGLVAAAATVLIASGTDPVTRVGLGFVVGEVVALVALVWGAVLAVGDEERDASIAFATAKRTLDISVALILGVLTLPLMFLAGIAVRLDSPGPVFFRQTRIGKDGTPFGMLKIRTMRADNDEQVFAEHLARLEASRHREMETRLRIEEDDRITRVGHFLRRWSIDELPNLWNVLRGSMSLVGPRPLVGAEAELVGLNSSRFSVKPGITGLAQVRGRDTITMAQRTQLDERYVDSRSLSLDLRILADTLTTVFRDSGDA
jgi:lipopolysaccharide/colanic/teichoic acid biosynthesis glycosyltransferase